MTTPSPQRNIEPKISDYDYFGSTIGNAFFSGVTFETLWDCVITANTREGLDENVAAAIQAKESLDRIIDK